MNIMDNIIMHDNILNNIIMKNAMLHELGNSIILYDVYCSSQAENFNDCTYAVAPKGFPGICYNNNSHKHTEREFLALVCEPRLG